MIEKLPYNLTKGVTAMREGLQIEPQWLVAAFSMNLTDDVKTIRPIVEGGLMITTWPWKDAAERLLYPGFGPGVYCNPMLNVTINFDETECDENCMMLARISALLHDDAEGFRVLHECVTNLGE